MGQRLSFRTFRKLDAFALEVIECNAKDETLNISMVSDFIRDFLTLKNKEIPNKKDVYAKFKQKYPTTTVEELETVLSELKSLVNPTCESSPRIYHILNELYFFRLFVGDYCFFFHF